MKSANGLSIEVYSSGTTRIADPDGELAVAQGLRFSTGYPGGLYLDASFYVARDVVRHWQVAGAKRVVFRNGLTPVYEGRIGNLERILAQAGQGVMVNAVGYWGALLMARRWRKRWADTRVSEDIWQWQVGAGTPAAEKCFIDRNDRLRFTPKAVAWTATTDFAEVNYYMPTGQTIAKIAYDYDQAGANFKLSFYDATNGEQVIVSGGGSGASQTYTLGTPVNAISLRFTATGNNTPAADGTDYGQLTNVTVSSETSAINLTEIATDIVGGFSALNSSTAKIGPNTYSLIPFIADGWETLADILMDAASFGDSSFNPWAVGLLHSERATVPDGKPVLFAEQYPALTDYDYAISQDEENLVGDLSIEDDYQEDLWNNIIAEYQDEKGFIQYVTPDDDANLKDATSITDYDQRDYLLSLGLCTTAVATNNGRRFLARHKDPQWRVTAPITVTGYIRGKAGNPIPASEIRAGMRIKVENYLNDLSGTGLTFLISSTEYDDESETCSIHIGPPPDLIYQSVTFQPTWDDETGTTSGKTPAGAKDRLNWKRKIGLKPGSAEWERASKATWAEKQRMLADWRKRKRKKG